jgi:predicted lipid-binding transport protein (Tim44 family)
MAHADIFLYAIVAIVLLARLWSVFGRRNDEDTQRPNPFATPAPSRNDDAMLPPAGARSRNNTIVPPPPLPLLTAPTSLAGVLEQVKLMDPIFDEKEFLQGARTAFTTIIQAFAKGDLTPVRVLLGPNVLPHFETAVAARAKAGETLETRIVRIREAETTAAETSNAEARITVHFESEQENILRDASGIVLSGIPGKSEEISDLWTFARSVKSASPDWQLVETRS